MSKLDVLVEEVYNLLKRMPGIELENVQGHQD
jgi:hypothetical protein